MKTEGDLGLSYRTLSTSVGEESGLRPTWSSGDGYGCGGDECITKHLVHDKDETEELRGGHMSRKVVGEISYGDSSGLSSACSAEWCNNADSIEKVPGNDG